MDKLQYILSNLPQFYDKDRTDSRIRTIIDAIVTELNSYQTQFDNTDKLVGIDTTPGDELYRRWGALMSIQRRSGESDVLYRNRIKSTISSMNGGTVGALKYSIAVALGISSDPVATNRRVQVIDAWLYDGTVDDKSFGSNVCIVDLDGVSYTGDTADIESIVRDSIRTAKASGVNAQVIFTNYRIMTYRQLQDSGMTYDRIGEMKYNQLGTTK